MRSDRFEQLHYGSNLLQDMIVGMQVTGNRKVGAAFKCKVLGHT